MADWSTIASLATAGGTLVLAMATFASVRSANRASRTGERALQIGVRPVLVQSRDTDPAEPVMWGDRHWATVAGGHGVVEVVDGNIYLAMLLRNVGSGIAVIQGWSPSAEVLHAADPHTEIDTFRPQTRDLYVPPRDTSFWQGAIRDPSDVAYSALVAVIAARDMLTIDVLYSDHEGGQRTVSRFALIAPAGDSTDWVCSVNRHWNLDRDDPRDSR
jgi:hypothetical protein